MKKQPSIRFITTIVLVCFSLTPIALADEAMLLNRIKDLEGRLLDMQKMLDRQNNKISDIEKGSIQLSTPAGGPEVATMSEAEFNERLGKATGGANKWLKDLSFKGDLRLRYEAFEHHSGSPSETDDRNRFRFRLRYGFEKKFGDQMKVGFAMASGEANNGLNVDPTSTNQTFTNNFNWKDIWIERAYATYTPNWAKIGPIAAFEITAGKFTNPFEKGSTDMIWDRDVKPEGVYEKIDFKLLDTEKVDVNAFFTAGQFILRESGNARGDAELFSYQLGFNTAANTPFFEKPVNWLSALSYYDYSDYARNNNFLIGTTSMARGNSNFDGIPTELDANNFKIWSFYNELTMNPMGVPFRPYFEVAHNAANAAVNDEDLAWSIGAKLGSVKKKGDWEASYAYKRIEADSVVGAFNDSDFGTGHANKRGSVVKLGYGLTDYLTANAAAYFVNNLTTGTGGFRDEEVRRFQADLVWKF